MRDLVLLALALSLTLTAAAQHPSSMVPGDVQAYLELPAADRVRELISETGPHRRLFGLLPEDDLELDELRQVVGLVAHLAQGPIAIGARGSLLGGLEVGAAVRTDKDLNEIMRVLRDLDLNEREIPTRFRRNGAHRVLVLGDEDLFLLVRRSFLLIANDVEMVDEMAKLEVEDSMARKPVLEKMRGEIEGGDLCGFLPLAKLLEDDGGEKMRPKDFGGTLFLEGLRRDLLGAERAYVAGKLGPGLRLRLRCMGEERDPDWSSGHRRHRRLPQLAGEFARMHLDRDIAAFWRSREDILPEQALPGLAEFTQNLDTLLAGLSTSELASAMQPGIDLIALEKTSGDARPLLPSFLMAFDLKGNADRALLDRIRVGFQTAIGAINLSAANEHRRPFLQFTRDVEGVEILAARYVGEAPGGEPGVADNFEPALVLVDDRLVIASDVSAAEALVRAVAAGAVDSVAGDLLQISGPAAARMLELNRALIEDDRILEEGETEQEAREVVDAITGLVRSVERLSFRRVGTKRGAVWDLNISSREN